MSVYQYYGHNGINADERKVAVGKCIELIKEHASRTKYIAVRGYSGLVVGTLIADKLDLHMLFVRKPKDVEDWGHGSEIGSPHTIDPDLDYAGYLKSIHYVIVDDIISSGRTVGTIVNKIKEHLPNAVCLGAVTYNNGLWVPQDTVFRHAGVYK